MLMILIGFLGGVLSGLMGVGGGIILVPLMTLFLGFSQLKAQGTSLGALLLPVGIFAAWRYYNQGYLDIPLALKMALGLALGAWIGAYFATVLPELYLKKAFGILMIAAGVKFLVAR